MERIYTSYVKKIQSLFLSTFSTICAVFQKFKPYMNFYSKMFSFPNSQAQMILSIFIKKQASFSYLFWILLWFISLFWILFEIEHILSPNFV